MKLLPAFLLIVFLSCNERGSTQKPADTIAKPLRPVAINNFTAHITKRQSDGSLEEMDTINGYRKYYFKNGRVRMEGKVSKGTVKDFRDSVWKYYNDAGQVMSEEIYNEKGKVSTKLFHYYTNNNLMDEVDEYFEGDYKDKVNFKFHKVEKVYTDDGKLAGTRHWVNGKLIK